MESQRYRVRTQGRITALAFEIIFQQEAENLRYMGFLIGLNGPTPAITLNILQSFVNRNEYIETRLCHGKVCVSRRA